MRDIAFWLLLASAPAAMAQSCISLARSTQCSAFNQSSISTNSNLTSLFPFLSYVNDVSTFDSQIQTYIATTYSQQRYQQLIGCSSVNLTNTTNIYARYTTSVLCNAIVQNSIRACGTSGTASRPLCADSCAEFAISEQQIASSPDLCGNAGNNAVSQIRADFTNCALPSDSLSGTCIRASTNEPNNCGYNNNLPGLCSYCAASSPNATDSCCANSGVEQRCTNVRLPTTSSMAPLFPSSTSSGAPTSTATGAAAAGATNRGLTGGQIAGIVIGSVLGALLIAALVIVLCLFLRRRRQTSNQGSVFNQPSPSRQGPTQQPLMTQYDGARGQPEMLPGGRVARMAALEGTSSESGHGSSPIAGAYDTSTEGYDDTPESQRTGMGPPIGAAAVNKRDGSLSSHSPERGMTSEEYSSPEGVNSGQSEQLNFFKDYYSQDEIRPGDTVATLWAYEPRANDEFQLERGDTLKIIGIWDDGWATGIKLSESAEEWEVRRHGNRDSGVSNGSGRPRPGSGVAGDGEIKAFPLVCVCLPQHWRKTIEGDTTSETGPSGGPPGGPPPGLS